jgi:hypothetical protein
VSVFVLSPEIEDRNAVEVDNWDCGRITTRTLSLPRCASIFEPSLTVHFVF